MDQVAIEIREKIAELATAKFPDEICGIVVNNQIVEVRNLAEHTQDRFILDPKVWIEYPQADLIWHTHTDDSQWSMADIRSCKQTKVPYYLLSLPLGREYYYNPNVIAPLIGRTWNNWIADCYALVRDWYAIEQGVELQDFERELYDEAGNYIWKSPEWDMYREFLPTIGFEKLERNQRLIEGDLILLNYGTPNPNHAAIFAQPTQNFMLHHQFKRLSGHSVYGYEERNITDSVWRHKTKL
jgi:proteasome lid subunit RPN8/RPN11